jgi:hypothetical protein
MAEFDRISAEPIDNEPYSLVKNPVPVVESILDFNGHKIDTGSWCTGDGVDENKKKVGKAKTASDPKLAKAAPAKTGEKKDDGKLVENVDAKEKKEKGQTTEVKTNTEVKAEKAPEAGKGGKFDSAAKSAASSNQSGAQKNKKFEENAKLQKHIDLFKKGVRALATDSKTAADAEKVLKKFDKISSYLKPRMEGVEGAGAKNQFARMDPSSVTVAYGNGRVLELSDGSLTSYGNEPMAYDHGFVRKILSVTGSKSLETLKGAPCVLETDLEVGQPFRMCVETQQGWRRWSSNSPVTEIK